jgi:hypothetical protein
MYRSKKIYITLFAACSIYMASAQGFIFRWTGGYAWQPGNNGSVPAPLVDTKMPAVDSFVAMSNSNEAVHTSRIVHNSYGHGLNIGFRLGYQINPYVTVDAGLSYEMSANISSTQLHVLYLPDSTGAIQSTGGYLNTNISTQSKSLTITPAITLSYSKPSYKFYPYLRAGLSLPIFGIIKHYTEINMLGAGPTPVSVSAPYYLGAQTLDTLSMKPQFSIGFTGAIGVVYRVHSFLQFFAEVNTRILNLKAKQANYTAWFVDGQDSLAARGVNRNAISHVPTLPFSNVGFNIGVQLFLNHKIFSNKDKFEENRKHKAKPKPKPESEQQQPNTGTTTPGTGR